MSSCGLVSGDVIKFKEYKFTIRINLKDKRELIILRNIPVIIQPYKYIYSCQFKTYLFCFICKLSSSQDLVMVLHSGIIPGGAWRA